MTADLSAIDVGWEVWSTSRGSAGVDGGGQQIEPLGGIVLACGYDLEQDAPRFLTLHPNGWRQLVTRWLTADEINTEAIGEPDIPKMCRAVRRLAESLGARTGDLTDEEIQRVAHIHALSGTVARARAPRQAGAPPRLERDLGPPAPPSWYVT